jgi:hypothetical protein
MRKLASFHHGCTRFISNRHIQPDDDGIWTYPSSDSVLEDAGLFSIETYIQRRRKTIVDFVKIGQSIRSEVQGVGGRGGQ